MPVPQTFSLRQHHLLGPKFRPDLSSSPPIAKPDWETYCYKVADMIIQEQSPQRVMDVRGKLYELLSHCIPATVILKVRSPLDACPLRGLTIGLDDCGSRGAESRRKSKSRHHALGSHLRMPVLQLGESTDLTLCNRKIACVLATKRYITWKLGWSR